MVKTGKVIYPPKRLVLDEETIVAGILAQTGKTVKFLPESHVKMADIECDGIEWEIKSPKGNSSRTLENNMRLALKQADNIIIYLGRIQIPEQKCLSTIKNRAEKLGKKHKIIAITKDGTIHKFYH